MELALTGVAVFVAIIAAYVAHQARGEARRSADAAEKSATASREYTDIELERRRDELAEREAVQTRASRAEVHAHIEPGTDGKPWLVIENRGPAHARDVQLEAGRVFEALLIDPSVLRIDVLFADRQDRSLIGEPSIADPSKYPAVLSWVDGSGPRQQQITLWLSGG